MKLHFFFLLPRLSIKCTRLVRNPESFTFVSSSMAAARFADAELNSELAKSHFCGQAPGAAGEPPPPPPIYVEMEPAYVKPPR